MLPFTFQLDPGFDAVLGAGRRRLPGNVRHVLVVKAHNVAGQEHEGVRTELEIKKENKKNP